MVKFKDTDFLHAASRVKSLERKLLTSRQLGQMVDAHSIDEAYKIMGDAGIGNGIPGAEDERALQESLLDTYDMAGTITGVPAVFNIFRYEYDGLNLKILLKSQALDKDPLPMMTPLGTVPPEKLRDRFRDGKLEDIPAELVLAVEEAQNSLARTNDPQTVDILIDKSVLAAMVRESAGFNNRFLQKLVSVKVDIANIRCLVRIKRMDKDTDFFKKVVSPGGSVSTDILVDTYSKGMDQIAAFLEASAYGRVLEPAMAQIRTGGTLSLFEKLCDNYLVQVVQEVRLIPFGIEPVLAYVQARENEVRGARIVMASRMAGVAPELIKERLRETYA